MKLVWVEVFKKGFNEKIGKGEKGRGVLGR